MASPSNPASSAELIRKHSKARVRVASRKRFVTGFNPLTMAATFSRPLTDADVRESLARQYR